MTVFKDGLYLKWWKNKEILEQNLKKIGSLDTSVEARKCMIVVKKFYQNYKKNLLTRKKKYIRNQIYGRISFTDQGKIDSKYNGLTK